MTNGRGDLTDDAAAVRRMVAGSEAALESIYDRYAPAIFAAAYRLTSDRGTAEEVVQETFLALWNRAETFDASAGSLAAWLHTIGRNRAIGTALMSTATTRSSWSSAVRSGSGCRRPARRSSSSGATGSNCRPPRVMTRSWAPAE